MQHQGSTRALRSLVLPVQKLPAGPDDAAAVEQASLLLANIYVSGGKLDLADAAAASAIRAHAALPRAHELRAAAAEHRDDADAAAEAYAAAWRLSRHANPAVGYRLAWNLLEAARPAAAVSAALEVCILCAEDG